MQKESIWLGKKPLSMSIQQSANNGYHHQILEVALQQLAWFLFHHRVLSKIQKTLSQHCRWPLTDVTMSAVGCWLFVLIALIACFGCLISFAWTK